MTPVLTFTTVYESALQGHFCEVVESGGARRRLPVEDWRRPATDADRQLVDACVGTTLDLGCGPGRMAEALAAAGRQVLGVDIVTEAVRQTRARGVAALHRDVFDPLPAEGRWDSVLISDGNIGIGGDPRRLLSRAAALVGIGGRVVVELAVPGAGVQHTTLELVTDRARSRAFAWAVVGADAWADMAHRAGFTDSSLARAGDRWYGVARRTA